MTRNRLARAALVAATALVVVPLTAIPAAAMTTIIVDTADDDDVVNGNCTLREAITAANDNLAVDGCSAGQAAPATDTIAFDILGDGPHTIQPSPPLPALTEEVVLDGYTQSGASPATETTVATLMVEIDGSASGSSDALQMNTRDSVIKGLVINRGGIRIQGSDSTGNRVEGNYIGTDVDGTAIVGGGGGDGVELGGGSSSNTVGGDEAAQRNVISGNSIGIVIGTASANIVSGNYIGTDVSGTIPLPNGRGVLIAGNVSTTMNVIGGTTARERNIISGNGEEGVLIQGSATENRISGNYIGTDPTGTIAVPNSHLGPPVLAAVTISGGWNNTIGGTGAGERNVISGNDGTGVELMGPQNSVSGNYIGTDASGTMALGNGFAGVRISASTFNTVGGTTSGHRNVISGNGLEGIEVTTGQSTISGNYIGTDAAGTSALPNRTGVLITGFENTVGGTTTGERNVISGNDREGIKVSDADHPGEFLGTVISGNYIGTDSTGTSPVGNGLAGVDVDGARATLVGHRGDDFELFAVGNLISGNGLNGVRIRGEGSGTVVSGNYIGTDLTGTAALGNGRGIFISDASDNTVGGGTSEERNVISGNAFNGVVIAGLDASDNTVSGNHIGTDLTGTSALGNGRGILISGAPSNTVGGTTAEQGNVISGNAFDGIEIAGIGASENIISANAIGTDVDGTMDLGNGGSGVAIRSEGQDNVVGGTDAGAGNMIAFNDEDGVQVVSANTVGNAILGNSLAENGGLGIDLGASGATDNDDQDTDSGPNALQNFPVLTAATPGGSTTVEGILNSAPDTTFDLEFFASSDCDASGHGEGRDFLGTEQVSTDGSGDAMFTAAFDSTVPAGEVVTATATDLDGNTSEFSACVDVEEDDPPPPEDRCPGLEHLEGKHIIGTSGKDVLRGTPDDDVICGLRGNDVLVGLEGGDVLVGGPGTDTARYSGAASGITVDLGAGEAPDDGDGGSDTLLGIENVVGSPNADVLRGDGGANRLVGLGGADVLVGRGGPDQLTGGGGPDRMAGGPGGDRLIGGGGADRQLGQGGPDVLRGGPGPDIQRGGGRNDRIFGQGGGDDIHGGRGKRDLCRQGPGTGPVRGCER